MTTPMWRQPKTVWSIAFACVISFMGIGLVDPILKPIADELGAGPSQVSLLFTSYLAVMGVAMLGTGWVSSRIGAKRTLLVGLALIIVGAALESVRRARLAVLAPTLDQLDEPALDRVRVAVEVMNELLAAAAATPVPNPTRKDG